MSSPQPLPSERPSPPESGSADGGPGRRRLRIPRPVVAGLAVTLLVGSVIAIGVWWGDGPNGGTAIGSQTTSRPAAPPWTAKAAERLSGLPALRYTGTFTSSGQRAQATLSVTRSGSAVGTITRDGQQALLVSVGGVTYLKGPPVFWVNATGPTALPEDFAGRWSKAPVTVLGFDIKAFLAPSSIAELVRTSSGGDFDTLGDRPVHQIRTSLGVYSVTAAEPHRLLRVEGVSGASFDVAPVPDAEAMLRELRARVASLGGARDPGVRFEHGELQFVNCNENVEGCTVNLDVATRTPAVAGELPGGDTSLRAVMTATISADGRTLGSCTTARPLGPARRVTLSCMVTDRRWSAWMQRARDVPGRHEYTAQARVVAESISPEEVSGLLAAVDQERKAR